MTRTRITLTCDEDDDCEHFYKNGAKRACDPTFLHELIRSGLSKATLDQVRARLQDHGFEHRDDEEPKSLDFVVQDINDFIELHFGQGEVPRFKFAARRVQVDVKAEKLEDVPEDLIDLINPGGP